MSIKPVKPKKRLIVAAAAALYSFHWGLPCLLPGVSPEGQEERKAGIKREKCGS